MYFLMDFVVPFKIYRQVHSEIIRYPVLIPIGILEKWLALELVLYYWECGRSAGTIVYIECYIYPSVYFVIGN